MKIELDLKLLEEIKLDANSYLALYLIWRKGYGYFKPINLNPEWEKLQQDGWVECDTQGMKTVINYNITDKFRDFFSCNFDSANKYQSTQ